MSRRHNTALAGQAKETLTVQLDLLGGAGRIVRTDPGPPQPRTTSGQFASPSPARRRVHRKSEAVAGRDAAIVGHLRSSSAEKKHVVVELQRIAFVEYRRVGGPISVNDVRHVLADTDYRGDPRVLSAAFPASRWQRVGSTTYSGGPGHARAVATFVPREG